MSKPVQPIPAGYEGLMAYIILKDASRAIEFYKQALGAVERLRMPGADGKGIGHAELQIGNSILMLADECPEAMGRSPQTLGGNTFCFVLYVPNVDEAFQRAVNAGATELRPVANQFYGDRSGMVTDPFGYQWALMTHIEDVSPEELAKRAAAAQK
jgi:PhnB protein